MTTLVLTLGVLAVCFTGMAIGLILQKKPLQGSCGGASSKGLPPDADCIVCGGDQKKCDTNAASQTSSRS
ncbi:MAG: ApbE family protein [Elusimicrobia bacterium]|nr:MAG: ApbE family protein [Elusimicrobiota bacterium]